MLICSKTNASTIEGSPATDLHLDAVPKLPTKRDPLEQLDLCWNKWSWAAHQCQILQTPPGAHEAPTGGLLGLAHRCQYYEPPRGRNWIGGAWMPRGTEWVGGVCPTTLIGRGNDALRDWMGGEERPAIVNRGGTGGARRPRGLLRGGVEGRVGGGRAMGIADTRGIWPRRLQDWGAHGPGDCRTRGHTAPEIAGLGGTRPRRLQDRPTLSPHGRRLSGTQSPRYVRGAGQRGSRQRGRIVDTASRRGWLMGRRWLVCGCSGRVLHCRWRPLYIVSSPLACRGYVTPLPWHKAACGVT